MKAIELKDLDNDQLVDKLNELEEERFNIRFQLATGQIDNHRRLRVVRATVARIHTVLREREIEEWRKSATSQEGGE